MYFSIKIIHVLTAVAIFGIGFPNFIYFLFVCRQSDLGLMDKNMRLISFTYCWLLGIAGFFQPITGFILIYLKDYPLSYGWWIAALGGYAIAGLAWLVGLYLLLRCREMLTITLQRAAFLPKRYGQWVWLCFGLGLLAFSALVLDYVLMAGLGQLIME